MSDPSGINGLNDPLRMFGPAIILNQSGQLSDLELKELSRIYDDMQAVNLAIVERLRACNPNRLIDKCDCYIGQLCQVLAVYR